jgi:ribosomal-protein-alanine N-acetyltransferase
MSAEPSPVTITTERLLLCLPDASAASRMVSYFESNREHLCPWEPPFPDGLFTNSFWERRLEQNQVEFTQGTSMRLAMFERDAVDGPVVGMANFTQFTRGAFMACTLGYSIDQDAEGTGLMGEALKAGIDYVFGTLGMHRSQANYMPVNERSGRLLRRLGFEVEGYARDYLYINGAWRDHILTSLRRTPPPLPEYLTARQRT